MRMLLLLVALAHSSDTCKRWIGDGGDTTSAALLTCHCPQQRRLTSPPTAVATTRSTSSRLSPGVNSIITQGLF